MNSQHMPVTIGNQAIDSLLQYCREQNLEHFVLVADENTYRVLGREVEQALTQQGWDVVTALLAGDEVIADERRIVQVLLQCDRQTRTFLAVGTGTLTDITRFTSHRSGSSFISLPTAPSVDGFTSIGAPLVLQGLKTTIPCHPPRALFAHLPVLCDAPQALCAAGFGDMIGKYLSAADWKLGHILWDEPCDEAIYRRLQDIVQTCAQNAGQVGERSREGMRILMETLIESGFCMLDFGSSAPASGAEHHMSHYWEMKLLRENRKAIFHGAKVGVASIISAGWYERIRSLSLEQVVERLDRLEQPDAGSIERQIHTLFGSSGDELLASQTAFIHMTAEDFVELKQRIVDRWQDVRQVAASVPQAQQIEALLKEAKGPVSVAELGLGPDELEQAMQFSHYLRRRFTVNKLRLMLGIGS